MDLNHRVPSPNKGRSTTKLYRSHTQNWYSRRDLNPHFNPLCTLCLEGSAITGALFFDFTFSWYYLLVSIHSHLWNVSNVKPKQKIKSFVAESVQHRGTINSIHEGNLNQQIVTNVEFWLNEQTILIEEKYVLIVIAIPLIGQKWPTKQCVVKEHIKKIQESENLPEDYIPNRANQNSVLCVDMTNILKFVIKILYHRTNRIL